MAITDKVGSLIIICHNNDNATMSGTMYIRTSDQIDCSLHFIIVAI